MSNFTGQIRNQRQKTDQKKFILLITSRVDPYQLRRKLVSEKISETLELWDLEWYAGIDHFGTYETKRWMKMREKKMFGGNIRHSDIETPHKYLS